MLDGNDTAKPMDLRRIRHFVTLAETLNFRRAAERLHMAQPPLTVSIQKLEAELGVKLFARESTGVTLTASGRAVLVEAKNLLFHGSQLLETAKGTLEGTGGILQIGFVGSSTYGMLQKLLPLFRAEYPGVELILREATSVAIMQQLQDNALDIGLVRVPLLQTSRATLVQLERDEYIAALPRGNALAGKRLLKLSDMAGESFVMYAPDHASGLHSTAMLACQHAGFIPRVTQQAIQIQTVLALVESGLGVALVPSVMQRYVSSKIVYRPFVDFPAAASIGLALAYMAETENPAASRFRQLASREFPPARPQ
ncbi:LysR family transcriptional regulator [Ottowia thiooxydans]|uniref:LysR family transcriptional regulator n=1 Tax=Ottowia thiooxydans TaxID=219182 RepID=UPI000426CAF8|nr:LysR family transcriptional regulator [Ottowia thiooxydans]